MATSGTARTGPLTLRATRASTIAIQFGALVVVVGTAAVAGLAAAAVIGAVAFVKGSVDRASGPILDPNDFGFLLASIIPLTAYRIVSATHRARRMLAIVALPCIAVGLLATFSRSALIGLAGAG